MAAPCSAGLIVASGAGSTLATAEDLTGLFPTEIVGMLSGTDPYAASMFKISNLQPANFSALTLFTGAFAIPDTVLTLFDSAGVGIYLNDDISGSNTMSCLGLGNPCPTSGLALPVGFYYLAISRSANYPVDSLSNEIFASGRLPAGISAQFGPKNVADPHSIPASYAGVGTVTVQFTATAPTAAAAGAPSRDCPYPAIRLANGGALDTFAVFEEVIVHVRTGNVVVQPSDRSALGVLLPPGNYSSITMLAGDMGLAIVPPSGSRSPIEVIGQASEDQ